MKTYTLIGTVASVFLVTLGMALVGAESDGPGDDESKIKTGLEYANHQGINLDLKRRNRALVGLGSYLVNAVGGCNDCHTAPPFTLDPYAALGAPKQINVACYLAGGVAFGPPPFGLPPASPVSRNLTPQAGGRPAGMTLDEFMHTIRTGEDPDNPGHVLRVMPWPVYQAMTDRDLKAVYEYLSAIPSINPAANHCGVPSI